MQEIKQYVAERVAAHKQLNGGVVILQGDDKIPKSASGKILRRELKERAKKEISQPQSKL